MPAEHHCESLCAYVSAQHGDLIDQEVVVCQQIGSMFHPEIAKDLAKCFPVSFPEQP